MVIINLQISLNFHDIHNSIKLIYRIFSTLPNNEHPTDEYNNKYECESIAKKIR